MIPSLLQIPSAVSDSKLHSVLPNNGKGDFTFDRSTGATRINKDGLIEEVGYFSSELVQNGNFSELGSELIVNGDFATDSDWTKGTGWIINDGKAINTGRANFSDLTQNNTNVTIGKTYKITYTISDYTSGSIKFIMNNNSAAGVERNANGTYTDYISALSQGYSFRTQGSGFIGKIDNVSVKQVDPNDRWTLGTNTTYGNNKVILPITSGGMQFISSNNANLTSGKLYKISFTAQRTSGTGQLAFTDSSTNNITGTPLINSDGDFVFNFTPASNITGFGFKRHTVSGSYAWELSNVSVVEVQGDRPRLSYDITNGVVEDKPHLLLEPSSTNLISFSEDFSQWTVDGEASISSDSIISPDGTKNSDKLIAGTTSSRQAIKFSISQTGNLSFSIFAKKGGYSVIQLSDARDGSAFANFNLDTGAVGSSSVYTASMVDMGNDWYRCKISWNASFDIFAVRVGIVTTPTSARVEQFAGNGSDGLYIYGAQLEQQAYCTSYIPTAGTTITRAAETCNNSKPSVNSTEGVLYAEYKPTFAAGSRQITISDGTYDDRIVFECRESGTKLRANVAAGGVGQTEITIPISSLDKYYKIAIQYKANDVSFYIDGELKGTDTSATMPTGLNVVSFSGRNDASLIMTGKTKGIAVYNEALSESQLMQLTGVTASSIYSNFVTRTASFTVEALNEVKKVIDNL
jgi:hypothetical protein